MKKAALHNLGCKVNSYETEAMKQQLEDAGYEIVDFRDLADIYIVNTCTVTNIADRKSRQMLHKAKKTNPDALVVAVGCYVQAAEEELKKDCNIDIIIGNNRKSDLVSIIENHQSKYQVIDIARTKEFEEQEIFKVSNGVRANIKIQDGCNQFCSYCIIPYTRGRIRSRRISDIIEEVTNIGHSKIKEVVLTGIHTASYGRDFEEEISLIDLIEKIDQIPTIKRIRLSSLEQGIITDEFLYRLSKLEKVCPHFHLSLQSGSNGVLKRMNRKYLKEDFFEKTQLIRKYYELPGITTDVIVGFPGESDEEYSESRDFIEEVAFTDIHVFKYSPRKGTLAAEMKNQIPAKEKSLRSEDLIRLRDKLKQNYFEKIINKELSLLVEEEIILDKQRYQLGYVKEYVKVAVISKENLIGEIIKVIPREIYSSEILLAERVKIY